MFGDTRVKRRTYTCKESMKWIGFAQASTNINSHENKNNVHYYYLEGFRPNADVSMFTIGARKGIKWARKDSPFE